MNYFVDGVQIGGGWLVLGLFIAIFVLGQSLERDMKQPHIWLHSPASMLELVTVKMVFVTFVTMVLIIWSQLIIVVMFKLSDMTETVSNLDLFQAMAGIFIVIMANSIIAMAILFFFWAIYQVLKTRTKTFGFILAFLLYVLAAMLWEKLRAFGLFKALAKVIPIDLTKPVFFEEVKSSLFLELAADSVMNSVGSIFFYAGLTVLLIWVGAWLLEKKVRL